MSVSDLTEHFGVVIFDKNAVHVELLGSSGGPSTSAHAQPLRSFGRLANETGTADEGESQIGARSGFEASCR